MPKKKPTIIERFVVMRQRVLIPGKVSSDLWRQTEYSCGGCWPGFPTRLDAERVSAELDNKFAGTFTHCVQVRRFHTVL